MTDAQLKGIATQALNMAKLDLERGNLNFLLAAYIESLQPKLMRMDKVEKLIIERLGENWLNNGATKDLGFGLLRVCVDLMPPDAVVVVTICNGFSPTAKFHELTPEQKTEMINASHKRHHRAVEEGLLSVCDVLMAVAQTPERVVMCTRRVVRGEFDGQPEYRCAAQEEFGGRLKMFGEDKHAAA
jgi:hypothetical protein